MAAQGIIEPVAWSSGVGRRTSALKQPAIFSRTSGFEMLLQGLRETGLSAPEHSQTQALIPHMGKGACWGRALPGSGAVMVTRQRRSCLQAAKGGKQASQCPLYELR